MAGKLQHELKKRQPFDSLEQEVLLNLFRTGDQIQIRFARLFDEHDLTPSQYNVLRILRGEGRPMKCMEIAERTITVVPGITGLIDRLEGRGLVARERDARDRRIVWVRITEAALERLAALDAPLEEMHRAVLAHLTREELETLGRLLEKARAACPRCPE